MGRPINSIRKELLRIKVANSTVKKLVQIGETVVLKMTGNANFTTPTPTLVSITDATTAVKNAMAKSNFKRARSSRSDQRDTVQKATDLKNLLISLLNYVTETALIASGEEGATFNGIIATSGFAIRSTRSITPRLQIATKVRQSNTKQYPGTLHRLDWRRPLGLIKGQPIAGYNIFIGGVIVQTVTKTNAFIPVAGPGNTDVMIQPFNSRGVGQSFFATVK